MARLTSQSLRWPLVGIVLLSACVSVQSPGSRRMESVGARFERIRDSMENATSLEDGEMATAPRIRLVIPPAAYASTRYVEASFHLSEDAYVLVVAVDLDRRARVLYPETPDQSGFATKRNQNRLTRFYAGFGSGYGGTFSRYEVSQRISPFGGGGVLLAVASDRPLQLERLVDAGGDWDERALTQLIFDQSLASAASAVGRAVVLTGQEFGTDYTTFEGRRTLGGSSSFASSSFGDCEYGYGYASFGYTSFGSAGAGYGYGSPYDATFTRFVGFYQRDGFSYARYASGVGGCHGPIYYDVPLPPSRVVPRDTTRTDSSATGRRFPRLPSVAEDGGTNSLARRLAAAKAGDTPRERTRPPLTAGLRFRPPEQVLVDGMTRIARGTSESGAMRPRTVESNAFQRTRPADRAQPVERRELPRAEPARMTPVRSEPVHREPVAREPMHAASAPSGQR